MSETLDLIEELKLRQWARQNYVPVSERSSRCHAVILDEMRLRDLEATEVSASQERIVPLEESRQLRIDAAHPLERGTRIVLHATSSCSEYFYS